MTQREEYASTFALLDADGDGLISAEELHQLMSALGAPVDDEQVRHAVSVMDADGDGLVSLQELADYLATPSAG